VPQFEFSDGIAPPGQEGWTRHQEKYREASFDGADGVVVQDQTEMFSNLNHHPVCAASDASHFLLTGAAAVAEFTLRPTPTQASLRFMETGSKQLR
jgi:hypothetical protein